MGDEYEDSYNSKFNYQDYYYYKSAMDPDFSDLQKIGFNGSISSFNSSSNGSYLDYNGCGFDLRDCLFKQMMEELNLIKEDDLVLEDWSLLAKMTLAFLYILIMTLALIGNIVVILVIAGNHKMQTVTNRFLLSLATSDICMAVFNMPLSLVFYIKHEWLVGEFLCKFASFLQGVFIVASIFTLTAIAIDRYNAILYPLKVRYIHTRTRAIIVITSIWVISMLVVSPQVYIQQLGFKMKIDPDDLIKVQIIGTCEERFKTFSLQVTYNLVIYILVYIIPVTIMAFTYGAIAKHLWRRQPIGELPTKYYDCERLTVETKSILRMVFTIMLFFIIAWMPFFSFHLYLLFHTQSNVSFEISAILKLIGYSNTCVNPVVYCFLNEKFRRCAKALFHSFGPVKVLCGSRQMRRLSSISTKVVMTSDTSNGK